MIYLASDADAKQLQGKIPASVAEMQKVPAMSGLTVTETKVFLVPEWQVPWASMAAMAAVLLVASFVSCLVGKCWARRNREIESVQYDGCCSTGCCSFFAVRSWAFWQLVASLILIIACAFLFVRMQGLTKVLSNLVDIFLKFINSTVPFISSFQQRIPAGISGSLKDYKHLILLLPLLQRGVPDGQVQPRRLLLHEDVDLLRQPAPPPVARLLLHLRGCLAWHPLRAASGQDRPRSHHRHVRGDRADDQADRRGQRRRARKAQGRGAGYVELPGDHGFRQRTCEDGRRRLREHSADVRRVQRALPAGRMLHRRDRLRHVREQRPLLLGWLLLGERKEEAAAEASQAKGRRVHDRLRHLQRRVVRGPLEMALSQANGPNFLGLPQIPPSPPRLLLFIRCRFGLSVIDTIRLRSTFSS